MVVGQGFIRQVDTAEEDVSLSAGQAFEILDILRKLLVDGAIWRPEVGRRPSITRPAPDPANGCGRLAAAYPNFDFLDAVVR
jgi:hypothetical protein